jgi:peptidoglycan hydrolase CwlO-like protein
MREMGRMLQIIKDNEHDIIAIGRFLEMMKDSKGDIVEMERLLHVIKDNERDIVETEIHLHTIEACVRRLNEKFKNNSNALKENKEWINKVAEEINSLRIVVGW